MLLSWFIVGGAAVIGAAVGAVVVVGVVVVVVGGSGCVCGCRSCFVAVACAPRWFS